MDKEESVIDFLDSYPAGSVYNLTTKEILLRGLEYYQQQRLIGYEPSDDPALLSARVRGTRIYRVHLFLREGILQFFCSCPAWNKTSQCKHLLCALLTTLNLFRPTLFKIPEDKIYRRRLWETLFSKKGLLEREKPLPLRKGLRPSDASETTLAFPKPKKEQEETGALEVVIEANHGIPRLSLFRKGNPVPVHEIPEEIKEWFAPDQLYDDQNYFNENNLSDFLSVYPNRYPLFFQSGNERIPVRWSDLENLEAITILNLAGNEVQIGAACRVDGKIREKIERLSHFVVEREEGILFSFEEKEGWQLYDKLYEMAKRGEDDHPVYNQQQPVSFSVPPEFFQSIGIVLDKKNSKMRWEEEPLLLQVNGEIVSPEKGEFSYALSIKTDLEKEGVILIRPECRLGSARNSPPESLFNIFSILEGKKFPPALRTQKRKKVIYDLFFALFSLAEAKSLEPLMTGKLKEGDFTRWGVKNEAKRIIRYYYSLSHREEERISLSDGKWYRTGIDKAKEAILYRIPYETFGPEVFRNSLSHAEMVTPAELFYSHFSIFYSRAKEAGINLFFNTKPVVPSTWEFSFDATRREGIDWFELKPEIRCNGELLSKEEWSGLFRRRGAVEKGNEVRIIDAEAEEVLKTLSEMIGGEEKGKPEKKEIVQVPKLQIFDWIALRKNGVRIRLSEEDEALVDRLLHFERIEQIPIPEYLKGELRPYQIEGYRWLAFLYRHRLGACLADDMGLGKTLQAIAFLAGLRENRIEQPDRTADLPHLVVVPTSLVFNWESELERFYPDFKVRVYTGNDPISELEEADILLTTYGIVRRNIEKLNKTPFNVMIFDEAQAVKNIYADTTGAVRQLKGRFKLVMSGTPLENHLGEYYSLIDLALPGLLGNYEVFRALTRSGGTPIDRMIKRTRPFVLRRTKEMILKELPPKMESDIYLELTEKQKRLYQQTVAEVRRAIDNAFRTKTEFQARIIALTALLRLRQISVSPRLVSPEMNEESPKIEFLMERLRELLDEGHSALVFSQFTSFLDLVEEELKRKKIPFLRLDGSTPAAKRKNLVNQFQEGKEPVIFLLSLKAGGQGLNLTRASYVFHLDPWWNPAVENQASDRAHRIGQKKSVTIIRILMRHTIEEKMMALKEKKRELYRAVMEDSPQAGSGHPISKSDLDFLLSP
jgi:superfamily II DNA or RNA helicase